MTIGQLNDTDREAFVAFTGSAFEHSPWIAAAAWERRPFDDLEDLLAKMRATIEAAPLDAKIALIAGHPDLAGRLAREGRLTAASQEEQRAAGLEHLSDSERAVFERLNARYRDRFGFPFVICAREQTKASILSALSERVRNERGSEIAVALMEIVKIARLRLRKIVTSV